ncbi:MAG: hypothetical protein EPO08_18675 [Rhodospirillaceae bacterium]|nr:MAG: hypothetical protein EPO08_18675 [Rhodospirillaceae bacterium]
MRVSYDRASMKVTVSFRGRIKMIDGTYASESEAISAGEMYCRRLGWQPETKSRSAVSMMRQR